MSKFKQTVKEKWLIILVAFFVIIKILPSNSSNQKSEYHSSVSNRENYYKWPCMYCGKRLPLDEMLSPNKYPYTPENGFVFCSQECYHAWRNLP